MKKGKEKTRTKAEMEIRILLDNIRSTHNVGSIFRTAETAGVSHIYCLGTTPDPVDRFGRKRADIAKVSLGAEELIPWEHVDETGKSAQTLIRGLKKEGFTVVALEQDKNSVDYRNAPATVKILLILGNEVGGVSKDLLKMSDVIIEIPMKGKKESLNVSVAAGVALFNLISPARP